VFGLLRNVGNAVGNSIFEALLTNGARRSERWVRAHGGCHRLLRIFLASP
jgi:hypothetical protein